MDYQITQRWFLDCPRCRSRTVLPRQSQIGKYGDQCYQPTGIWPLTFLCHQCGQLSAATDINIHFDAWAGRNLNLDKTAL